MGLDQSRDLALQAGVPYLRLDVTNRQHVMAVNDYLAERRARDVALIFPHKGHVSNAVAVQRVMYAYRFYGSSNLNETGKIFSLEGNSLSFLINVYLFHCIQNEDNIMIPGRVTHTQI